MTAASSRLAKTEALDDEIIEIVSGPLPAHIVGKEAIPIEVGNWTPRKTLAFDGVV
jgi:hypothetical protein